MGDDEFEVEDGMVWERVSSQPARPIDFAIVGVDFARRFAGLAEEALTGVMQLMCEHANFMTDKRAFEDEARAAIESLTQEE